MAESNVSYQGGTGFCGLLCLAFIVLKLTGYITWSWIWVVSPIWLPMVTILLILLLAYIIRNR